MKNLIVFFSLIVVNSAIRVPNSWQDVVSSKMKEIRPRRSGIIQSQQKPDFVNTHQMLKNIHPEVVASERNTWFPVNPLTIPVKKNKYFKKPIQQIYKKKRGLKPFNTNYNSAVPYITYKKPTNTLDSNFFLPPRPLTTFINVYPRVQQKPKHQSVSLNVQHQKPSFIYSDISTNQQKLHPMLSLTQNPSFLYSKVPSNLKVNLPKLPTFNQNYALKIPEQKSVDDSSNIATNYKPNSYFVPSQQPNRINTYEPDKNIVKYFEAVKDEKFPRQQISNENKQITKQETENQFEAPRSNYEELETTNVPKQNTFQYFSHPYKNYRDDKTYEPEQNDEHFKQENTPTLERTKAKQAPISSHEFPVEIPTKPIYPGEGQWAQPGIKHKPFISQQTYANIEDEKDRPEGYDIFINGQNVFNTTENRFNNIFRSFPEQHKLGSFLQQKPDSTNSESQDEPVHKIMNVSEGNTNAEEDEEEEFVPSRLYAQVRASENKEYLPYEEGDDGKLREAIKESKIHTVYTEEGYEDSAYDHAGHEKDAENNEGFEDLQREKIEKNEKRVPQAKLNLHLPRITKYEYGGELLTDDEIAAIKEEQLGLGDSDVAGTEFKEPFLNNNEEKNLDNTENDKDVTKNIEFSRKPKNSNNFISTKETKTMTTKEMDDGDTETEISSKVKIILQPNNSTMAQKYSKVYPKVYKTIRRKKSEKVEFEEPTTERFAEPENASVDFSGIFIEEITSRTEIPITDMPTTQYQEFSEEFPITTLPTTAIPKSNIAEKALGDINKEFLKIHQRVRRSITYVPNINHDLAKVEDYRKTKYPYYDNYKEEGLNIDSPLRYSEDIKKIPKKTGKKMVFYEDAEKAVPCPDIEAPMNFVPDRVLNAEKNKLKEVQQQETDIENNETDENESKVSSRKRRNVADTPNTPKLSGLGDKIDCLKTRYFGDNPLDSPFFDEVTVGTIEPIFKELQKYKYKEEDNENNIEKRIQTKKQKNNVKVNNVLFKADKEYDDINEKQLNDNMSKDILKKVATTTNQPEVVSIPVMSLLTTPDYTINLKPKHIYDQIELLEHLPKEASLDLTGIKRVPKSTRQSKSINEDNLTYESSDDAPALPEAEELKRRRKIRRKRPPFQIFDINKFLPTTPPPISFKPSITQPPLIKPNVVINKHRLQIYDVNKFIPTTPFPIYKEVITSSTVLPKYKVLSEVFYKDDIKPNEQLNVFTDILNNIKNSSHEEQRQSDASIESSEHVHVTLNSKPNLQHSNNRNYLQDSYLKAYGDQEIEVNYSSPMVTTTTLKPTTYRGDISYKIRRTTENPVNSIQNNAIDPKLKLYLALLEAKRDPQNNKGLGNYGHMIQVYENSNENIDTNRKVMGLMPPGIQNYKTIHHPKRDSGIQLSNPNLINRKINRFLVPGMKPPPHQKIMVYSDYLNSKFLPKKIVVRRGKRSTSKGLYESLSRNKQVPQQESKETDDDNDDYVPHRPKNYYYDEKTGKIVYLTTEKPTEQEEEEEEEEVEYEEISEKPDSTTTSKPLQNPIFVTATPPPAGESYLDFILKVKQNPNYKLIPDPTTTEKNSEPDSSPTTTTQKPISTTPPEFLNILGKVRQSNQYKLIEDKKVTKSTTTAPEEIVEDEVEEDDDTPQGTIQNSPGGQKFDMNEHFGIFDVTDFIPKIKNYIPKTAYDTSKYKTIARSTVKTTTTAEDEIDEENFATTTHKPIKISTTESQVQKDNLNEATISRQSESEIVTHKRRRPTTTTVPITTTTTSTTEKINIAPILRRRRPTTLKTTTPKPTSLKSLPTSSVLVTHEEKVRRVLRRRPTTTTTPKSSEEEPEETTKVLRRRSGTTNHETLTTKSNNFVESFKKFHQNKKRKKDDLKSEEINQTPQYKHVESVNQTEMISESPIHKDVEIISQYDKTKRHGGNYRKLVENNEDVNDKEISQDYNDYNQDVEVEEDAIIEKVKPASEEKTLRISLLSKNNDKEEDEYEEKVEDSDKHEKKVKDSDKDLSKETISKKYIHKKYVTEPSLLRLTDVVPNPDAFYSDPTLPKSVNMLAVDRQPTSAEIKEILNNMDSSEISVNKDKNEKNVYFLDTVTKKPVIIKDPSKRLYYYAPI